MMKTFIFRNPNLLYDGSWAVHEPRGHWYMNFNYSKQDEMTAPGKIERDYRYEDVAFWNEYIPQVCLVRFQFGKVFFFSASELHDDNVPSGRRGR